MLSGSTHNVSIQAGLSPRELAESAQVELVLRLQNRKTRRFTRGISKVVTITHQPENYILKIRLPRIKKDADYQVFLDVNGAPYQTSEDIEIKMLKGLTAFEGEH